MNPKVADRGTSFKGAGQYYLHDKDADTTERVEFTHTENLITSDPDKAIKCMAWTAMHQKDLKRNAGLSLKGNHGCKKPVYSYSLAWHPEQDPTKDQMIEAAKSSLEFLGLQEHEALMVAHNDTEHPHVHVIVNLVHPGNGKTAKYRDDYKRFSRWAQAYQEERGESYSPLRVENNKRRDKGEFIKPEQDNLYDWRRKRQAENFERRLRQRNDLTDKQKEARINLFRAKENIIEREQIETREENRKEWRKLYRKQEQERARVQQGQEDRKGDLDAVLKGTSGNVLREQDDKRKGFLAHYHRDVVSQTVPDKPDVVKKRNVNERRKAQKSRADDLNNLLSDKDGLHRDSQKRMGKLARFFSDITSRSKQDVALDEKEKAATKHQLRMKERRENDMALKRFLATKNTLHLDIKDRTGKLSNPFTDRGTDDSPAGQLKSTMEQRLLRAANRAKKANREEKKIETKKRRSGQFARRSDLKKMLSDKGALRRENESANKLTGVFGDHTNRSKEDVADDKRKADKQDRQDQAVRRRDDDHELSRSLKNPKRIEPGADKSKGKLSKPFSNRAEDKDIGGERNGPDNELNHPLDTSSHDKGDTSKDNGLDEPTKRRASHLSDPEQLDKQHAAQRKALGKKIKDRQKANIKEITELYNEQLGELDSEQQLERDDLSTKHSRESQKAARNVKDGRDIEEYDRENKYTAFRDMRDDVTRDLDHDDRGSDRSRKGPEGSSHDK